MKKAEGFAFIDVELEALKALIWASGASRLLALYSRIRYELQTMNLTFLKGNYFVECSSCTCNILEHLDFIVFSGKLTMYVTKFTFSHSTQSVRTEKVPKKAI